MRYQRTHSCGQDLTPSRLDGAERGGKKEPKRKWKALKVCPFWKKPRIWLHLWQLESDWLQISVPDGLYKCLRFQCIACPQSAVKIWAGNVSSWQRYNDLAGQMLSSEMTFSLWFCVFLRLRVDQTIPLKLMENRSRRGPALRTLVYTEIILHWPRHCLMNLARIYRYVHCCSAIISNQLHPNCLYG